MIRRVDGRIARKRGTLAGVIGRMPPSRPDGPTLKCSWCGATMYEGDPEQPVSHGLCRPCKAEHYPERVGG